LRSPAQASFDVTPISDCVLGKPDCEVTAPTQCIVVLGPVCHLLLGLDELVAATLAVFVGHLLFLRLRNRLTSRQAAELSLNPIYSTTPYPCHE